MTEDKRPIAIYHALDAEAYYAQTTETQDAWDEYAQREADKFDNDPGRDSYDSTNVFIGVDRDGNITPWCPPVYFPEWLVQHSEGEKVLLFKRILEKIKAINR